MAAWTRTDFVLFWAEPVSRWEYSQDSRSFQYRHNVYTRENAYWLGFGGGGEGRRAEQRSGALVESDPQQPTSYRVRVHEEAEQFASSISFMPLNPATLGTGRTFAAMRAISRY